MNLSIKPVSSVVNKFQNNQSTKIVKENLNVLATFLVKGINTCIKKGKFPNKLKTDDITPAFKKGDKNDKSNYRPISILPIFSKVYERYLYKQTENYMENILSNFQCGFRKGFNTQQCLIGMIEKAKGVIDKGEYFKVSLTYLSTVTDLSKAFDCLPHTLIIAKLDVYGFKKNDLYLILNYLNNRKQRVKTNSSFSSFQNIIIGAPQGFLLGPLLTFFLNILKLQAMLMTKHHTQQEIVLKNFAKSRKSLNHTV